MTPRPLSEVMPRYRITRSDRLVDTVEGLPQPDSSGALVIREALPARPGQTRPGPGEVISIYAPGHWLLVEKVTS